MLTNFNKMSAMPKLDHKFVGPYEVVECLSGNKYIEKSVTVTAESHLDYTKLMRLLAPRQVS